MHFAPRLKAREGVRSQQILIDFKSDQGLIPFADNPITVLKGRFNKALQDIEDANGYKTRAVSHLRNGGILMELDSEEAVTWFTGAVTRKRFLEKLHLAATIKPRLVAHSRRRYGPDGNLYGQNPPKRGEWIRWTTSSPLTPFY